MDVSIARAKPEDAAALSALARAAKRHWGYPENWMAAWAKTLTLTPEYIEAHPVFVASTADERVGFYALVLKAEEAVLEHLWIFPAVMNSGVGRALFEHAERSAVAAGASKISIEADPNAEGFYVRMGAATLKHAHSLVAGTARSIPVMEKQIG